MKSIKNRIREVLAQVYEIKVIHVLVGKNKQAKDKDDQIIFHIDV